MKTTIENQVRLDQETPVVVTLLVTGEVFSGSPKKIVSEMRKGAFLDFQTNDRFMREWSIRAELFTKLPIDWLNEESFLASNAEAGIIKLEELK